jgi:DnaJ-class molecular chaperone
MSENTDKLAECPNCEGDGFLTDSVGYTMPCGVCEGEGEIPEADVDKMNMQAPQRPSSQAGRPPWEKDLGIS